MIATAQKPPLVPDIRRKPLMNKLQNLTKPDLKAYIDEQLELQHTKRTADAQEVLEYLTSVMRGEHTEQVFRLNGNGVQVVDYIQVSAQERLKAAELIGKRYGMFKGAFEFESIAPIILINDLKE